MLDNQTHKQKSVRDYLISHGGEHWAHQITRAANEIRTPFNFRALRGVQSLRKSRLMSAGENLPL